MKNLSLHIEPYIPCFTLYRLFLAPGGGHFLLINIYDAVKANVDTTHRHDCVVCNSWDDLSISSALKTD